MFGFGKGSIQLTLNKYQFSKGEKISGELVLKLKKPLQAEGLVVGIRAYQETRGKNRETREIYNSSHPIGGTGTYQGEMKKEFSLDVPASTPSLPTGGAIGNALKVASVLGAVPTTRWEVYAKLDVKGLDVKKDVEISVA